MFTLVHVQTDNIQKIHDIVHVCTMYCTDVLYMCNVRKLSTMYMHIHVHTLYMYVQCTYGCTVQCTWYMYIHVHECLELHVHVPGQLSWLSGVQYMVLYISEVEHTCSSIAVYSDVHTYVMCRLH